MKSIVEAFSFESSQNPQFMIELKIWRIMEFKYHQWSMYLSMSWFKHSNISFLFKFMIEITE